MPVTTNEELSDFLSAARRYAERSLVIQQDPRHDQREYRLAIKNLATAASHLTEQPRNPPETVGVTAALIDAGQTYGTNPSIDAYTELLATAIRWYSVEGEESNETNNRDENFTSNTWLQGQSCVGNPPATRNTRKRLSDLPEKSP